MFFSFYGQEGFQLNLKSSMASVLVAGTDTVATFLEWFVLYMAAFQDVQDKCFQDTEARQYGDL